MTPKVFKLTLFIFLGALLGIGLAFSHFFSQEDQTNNMKNQEIILPPHQETGPMSVEQALGSRRSIRQFTSEELTLEEVSQLLWAAQGISDADGKRTSPSAGATYPLEIYLVAERVVGLEAGVYRFLPDNHSLVAVDSGEKGLALAEASLGQSFIAQAAANVVMAAVYQRTTGRYGERGEMYVHMEAGHAAQNVYLQCESLGLGTVVVGAFSEGPVKDVLGLPAEEIPLYIIPIGRKP